ncbi:MOSC domain-containing protein [Fischerella thermalis CCMEE 5282]|uniref:MOSC domain-containing protein n=1 Tax=Fischerella thermalis TaxID=372787 RepID=UPI000C802F5E|nr:MOSC domain-containing protein [Fischerella thermalis]PMB09839.1 MOSC domain-containing protein [Fischerella thermalis CCMEE 5328]PMB13218.1 MOSC domain-containing protein [Fischerella thermalis CCMEE 5282]
MTKISVQQLLIYPVKGLSSHKCDRVYLKVGHGIPGDRAFALMYKQNATDTSLTTVSWMNKQNFAMQNDWPGLAALNCFYDPDTGTFTVKRKAVELLVADTKTGKGRDLISAFFTGYLAGIYPSQAARHPNRAPLQLVGEFDKTRYPDREAVHISLVSRGTIDNLSQLAGQPIDVRRFRPNIVVEGVPAWGEFDWVGKEIQLGTARIFVTARINRCLNIDVHPETGERDMRLLSLLQEQFQHTQTGVLAQVISSGSVAIGEELMIMPDVKL